MTIAQRLAALLTRRHMTPTELADAAGISKQQLNQYLVGQRPNLGALTLERIVKAGGETMSEFFSHEEKP